VRCFLFLFLFSWSCRGKWLPFVFCYIGGESLILTGWFLCTRSCNTMLDLCFSQLFSLTASDYFRITNRWWNPISVRKETGVDIVVG
jgi:hypothetical protein